MKTIRVQLVDVVFDSNRLFIGYQLNISYNSREVSCWVNANRDIYFKNIDGDDIGYLFRLINPDEIKAYFLLLKRGFSTWNPECKVLCIV